MAYLLLISVYCYYYYYNLYNCNIYNNIILQINYIYEDYVLYI